MKNVIVWILCGGTVLEDLDTALALQNWLEGEFAEAMLMQMMLKKAIRDQCSCFSQYASQLCFCFGRYPANDPKWR